jgi:hypothetical protein
MAKVDHSNKVNKIFSVRVADIELQNKKVASSTVKTVVRTTFVTIAFKISKRKKTKKSKLRLSGSNRKRIAAMKTPIKKRKKPK